MTPEALFAAANLVALVSWITLILAPWLGEWSRVAVGRVVPALLAAAYVILIAVHWIGHRGGFSSLPDVALLFQNPWLLLAGWVHYLAFDLLIGCWEERDARERGVPRWLVVPCLLLTFMFGPAGWLAYQGVRTVRKA
jgi:hypothetical protein